MSRKHKVRSDVVSKGRVANSAFGEPKPKMLVFDFSSPSAWRSCKMGEFNNYLSGEVEFVEKFRDVIKLIQTLSSHKPTEVFNSGSFKHCHAVPDEKSKLVATLLSSKLGISEQIVEGETLLQAGIDGGLRVIGACTDNVFYVYLIDYNHSLHPDERKNRTSKANMKFCPIAGRR